ncbi:MAG: PEP/pyruvate-binding domain-containing protein [Verrucomicrobiales bacterium]
MPPWIVASPGTDAGAIREAAARLGTGPFAVRSSAQAEDGAEHSFAGQFESFLNVSAADVPAHAERVWASGGAERVRAYLGERGIAEATARRPPRSSRRWWMRGSQALPSAPIRWAASAVSA